MKVAYSQDQIYCKHEKCPLQAAIIVPILESNETSKLIKLYFRKSQHIRSVEIVLAQGLGKLLTNQLAVVQSEKLQTLIRDAELRNLEAQINPHFLLIRFILSLPFFGPTLKKPGALLYNWEVL